MKSLLSFLLFVSPLAMAAFTPLNRPIDVEHYKMNFQLDPRTSPDEFLANVEIKGKAKAAIDSVSLDLEGLTINKVTPIGSKKALKFEANDKTVTIKLPAKLKAGKAFALSIDYKGKVNTEHNGFFKVTDPDAPERGTMYFTQLEALYARRFLPCNDEPYDKATTEMIVRVPAGFDALSNGKRIGDNAVSKGDTTWREVQWLQGKPHPTYLISVAIGPFSKIEDNVGGKEISVWASPKKIGRARYTLDVTKKTYQFFEEYLGVSYPWDKYATIGLPTFLWGGMENTSSTHMNEDRTLLNDNSSSYEKKRITNLAAHELAHQWFGDYVTMKWWDDVWLNESFATLLGTLGTKAVFKNEEAEIELVLDAWDDYFRQEDGPRSHPIVSKALDNVDDAFDSINYTKGANVLRMMSFYLGEDKFRAGVKAYLQNTGLGNANYKDFFAIMEKTTGEKLDAYRDSWILQRGYPVITYAGQWNKNEKTYQLTVKQRPNHKEDSHTFVFNLPVVFHRRAEPAFSRPAVVKMTQGQHEHTIALPAEPEWVTVNPGGYVLGKIAPESRDANAIAKQLLQDPDPIARVWAAYDMINPLIDGKSISGSDEKAIAQLLNEDKSPYVRNSVLEGFKRMKGRWLPNRLADAVYEQARKSLDPGPEIAGLQKQDPHGWGVNRSLLLACLGKVNRSEVMPLLALELGRESLPLDDLSEASFAVASLADSKSPEVLRTALKHHGKRGYRYQYVVQYAFGSYASPAAANEIKEIAKTASSDFMGRIGWVIKNNEALRLSKEWSAFLKEFIIDNKQHSDEIKSRLISTIEDVKESHIRSMLEEVATKAPSERLKESARKILSKNYTS